MKVKFDKMDKEKIEELSIEKAFELLLKFFPEYMDYYESDIGAFLIYKSFKKYTIYISLRIISAFLFIISIFLNTFSEVYLIKGITMYIAILCLFVFFYIDKLIHKKYKYTSYFFHKIKKKLIKFKIKLDLLLNNTYLTEKYNKDKFDFEVAKNKSYKLKERIENDIGIIKSYSNYINKFAIPSILFAPLITFFITFVNEMIQNPIPFNVNMITPLFFGIVNFSILFYIIISGINSINKSRKIKETSIYSFLEVEIFMLLEFLRLKLRIIQFPKEEKIKKILLNVQKKISEKLKALR